MRECTHADMHYQLTTVTVSVPGYACLGTAPLPSSALETQPEREQARRAGGHGSMAAEPEARAWGAATTSTTPSCNRTSDMRACSPFDACSGEVREQDLARVAAHPSHAAMGGEHVVDDDHVFVLLCCRGSGGVGNRQRRHDGRRQMLTNCFNSSDVR